MEPIQPHETPAEHAVYELFFWSILIKGVISLAEVAVGGIFLLIPVSVLIQGVQMASGLLSANSSNPLVAKVVSDLSHFGGGTVVFVALYLLSRGLIKIFLVWALFKNVLWAYPASLLVLGGFLAYQAYEIAEAGSIFVIAISIFDIIVMYSIWREWKVVREHSALTA